MWPTRPGGLVNTRRNVKHVVDALRSATPILKPKVDADKLKVVGATYSLDTGVVSFLDEK